MWHRHTNPVWMIVLMLALPAHAGERLYISNPPSTVLCAGRSACVSAQSLRHLQHWPDAGLTRHDQHSLFQKKCTEAPITLTGLPHTVGRYTAAAATSYRRLLQGNQAQATSAAGAATAASAALLPTALPYAIQPAVLTQAAAPAAARLPAAASLHLIQQQPGTPVPLGDMLNTTLGTMPSITPNTTQPPAQEQGAGPATNITANASPPPSLVPPPLPQDASPPPPVPPKPQEAAACRPLSQAVRTQAFLNPQNAFMEVVQEALATLNGTVTIINGGGLFLPIEFVSVRVCSREAEHLRTMARCPEEDITVGPYGNVTCNWEVPLPPGTQPSMYNGLIRCAVAGLFWTGKGSDPQRL